MSHSKLPRDTPSVLGNFPTFQNLPSKQSLFVHRFRISPHKFEFTNTHVNSPAGTRKTVHIYFHYMLAYIIPARCSAAHITHCGRECMHRHSYFALLPAAVATLRHRPSVKTRITSTSTIGNTDITHTRTHSQQPRWHGYNYYCRQCARGVCEH